MHSHRLLSTSIYSGRHRRTGASTIQSVFNDARLMNAIVVLDRFQPPGLDGEGVVEGGSGSGSSSGSGSGYDSGGVEELTGLH